MQTPDENGNGHTADAPKTEVPPSRVIIEFHGTGAATFDIRFQNVMPAQMAALAKWLNWHVDRIYSAQADAMEQAHQAALAVPQLIVPNGVLVKH